MTLRCLCGLVSEVEAFPFTCKCGAHHRMIPVASRVKLPETLYTETTAPQGQEVVVEYQGGEND